METETKVKRRSRIYGKACVVCDKRQRKSSQLSWHCFPKNLELRQKWKDACGLTDRDDISRCVVCSKHFKKSDVFRVPQNKIRLIHGVIPCIDVPCPPEESRYVLKKSREKTAKKSKLVHPPHLLLTSKVVRNTSTPERIFINDNILEIHPNSNKIINESEPGNSEELIIQETPKMLDTYTLVDDEVEQENFYEKPKSVSELSEKDFATESRSKFTLKLITESNDKQCKVIKHLQHRNSRLSKRIEKLEEFIENLENRVNKAQVDCIFLSMV